MSHRLSILGPQGNSISVTAAGTGPALILLHGFPLDHRMWNQQLKAFAGTHQVIAMDFRGFGHSEQGADQYRLAELAADVECIRNRLANGRRVTLCGLSWGGYVAFEYWNLYAEHLDALVFAHTKPNADSEVQRRARTEMADRSLNEGAWEATRGMLPKLLAQATIQGSPGTVDQISAILRETSSKAVAAAQAAMKNRASFEQRLSEIKIPTLTISGKQDTLAPPAESRDWSSKIRDNRMEVIEQTAHISPIEQPEAFNRVLADFLR